MDESGYESSSYKGSESRSGKEASSLDALDSIGEGKIETGNTSDSLREGLEAVSDGSDTFEEANAANNVRAEDLEAIGEGMDSSDTISNPDLSDLDKIGEMQDHIRAADKVEIRFVLFDDTPEAPDNYNENRKEDLESVDENFLKDDNPLHKNCPRENGSWIGEDGNEGERGDSKWVPDREFVPQKSNPDNLSWGEIMDANDIDGITFENGEPQFDRIMRDEVKIENFTADRDDNFDQADQKLAEKLGIDADEVAAWRVENRYTWHECRDMQTLQLVPSIIHNNVTHRGGVSEAKGA